MDTSKLADILQNQLPNALKSFNELERSITPFLSQVAANRDKIDPQNMELLDKALADIDNAKKQMREYGTNNNR
jgi:predicted component of type VI protein secretion system